MEMLVKLSWWSSGLASVPPVQETGVQSLVRELDPMCHNRDQRSRCATIKIQHSQINENTKEKQMEMVVYLQYSRC